MPFSADYRADCNCVGCRGERQLIPDAEPTTPTTATATVAEPEADTEEPEACSNCGDNPDDCGCIECSRCVERVASDDICSRCDYCMSCCEGRGYCFTCECCGRRRDSDSQCSHCNECDRCCSCSICARCSDRYNDEECGCSGCGTCADCECICEPEESPHHCELLEAGDDYHVPTRGQHKRNPTSRLISAEIEVAELGQPVYGSGVRSVCEEWGAGVVKDGSLPETGFEINTAPAGGDKFVTQIEDICKALAKGAAKVTTSCGLHVHIDARDFGWWDIRRLIKLYALIEPSLFSLVPESRQDNQYCRRCGPGFVAIINGRHNPRKVKESICRAVYQQTDIKRLRKEKYVEARYSALNLHSWVYRGTVECRLFGGTTQAAKIINWGMLWAGILDYAYTHTEKQIDALKVRDGWSVLLETAPTSAIRDWLNSRHEHFGD